MKVKEFQLLCEELLANLPGYRCQGRLLVNTTDEHVLRGFCFEPSDFDRTSFYVNVFFLPLYVPTTHLYFTFGDRLRDNGGDRWNVDDPNLIGKLVNCIQSQGIPLLSGVRDPLGLAEVVQERFANSQDPYVLEAIAYSLLMGSDHVSAPAALDRLLAVLDPTVSWQNEMRLRAEQLKRLALDDAKRLLANWELATRANLRIQD